MKLNNKSRQQCLLKLDTLNVLRKGARYAVAIGGSYDPPKCVDHFPRETHGFPCHRRFATRLVEADRMGSIFEPFWKNVAWSRGPRDVDFI